MSQETLDAAGLDDLKSYLSTTEDLLEDARAGRMFILVDAEDRENEGDLVIPAALATPEAINFMAKHGRGLICLTLTEERARELNLELMSRSNRTRHQTAFTVSIEAREGVTTGISAHDRALTIAVAIDPAKGAQDIVTPGHVFPLVAREGGVLVRTGHTEAATDIARLAGHYPAGVICEIMNDDGTMARLPDLVPFAQRHGLKIGTIADLIAYRRRHDHLVKRIADSSFESEIGGAWRAVVFANTIEYAEHVALVKGDIAGEEPVLVRMHSVNVLEDLLARRGGRKDIIAQSMRAIAEEGRGAIVILRDNMHTNISDRLAPPPSATALRDYGIGAQILGELGVINIVLLSNTDRTVVALEGYDLHIVGRRPIPDTEER